MNIGIIGSGVYAIAIMHALEKNKENKIKMWTHSSSLKDEFDVSGRLSSVIDCDISSNVTLHTDLSEVMVGSDLVYIVTTSNFYSDVVNRIKKDYTNQHICIATKGVDASKVDFFSNVTCDELNTDRVSVISGPSFAIDVINDDVITLTVGSNNRTTLEVVEKSISSDCVSLELINDIVGIQVCNTFKNIVAIASGMLNGLGYSNSTNAALITKAINELALLIKLLGGKNETALLSCGIGDLLLTCTSVKSRNFTFGNMLIEKDISEIDFSSITVEGYDGLLNLKALLDEKEINSNLINLLINIVKNGKNKEEILQYLIKMH